MMRLVLIVVCIAASVIIGAAHSPPTADSAKERIDYYSGILAKHPERYPLRVFLAEAYLDEAQKSLDPVFVVRARGELKRSLETQESFEAFAVFAQVENFAHRFESALVWIERAVSASVSGTPTPDLVMMRIEALLGLGRMDEVESLVDEADFDLPAFLSSAARGRLLAYQGCNEKAVHLFKRTARLACAVGDRELAGWACLRESKCYLDEDEGSPLKARSALEMAEGLLAGKHVVTLLWAEFHETQGDWRAALDLYNSLLQHSENPSFHHLAMLAARRLDLQSLAEDHFNAAERGYTKAIDAGEVYTLGALARLYLDAEVQLDEASQLARRHLQYVKDKGAKEMLAHIEKALM